MRKWIVFFCLMFAVAAFAFDPVTSFIDGSTGSSDNSSSDGDSQGQTMGLLSKGKIDLIYLNSKFYFYPKLQFMQINFLRPHTNKSLYLMGLQISTSVFRGLGGDSETVLLPYQMISPHCGLLDAELIFRTTFINSHKSLGYMGIHARASLKFNSYAVHVTNDNSVAKKMFPSFYGDLSLFGQVDLGEGDVVSTSMSKDKKVHLVGFIVLGGLLATASQEHITESLKVTGSNLAYGLFGEIGIIFAKKHEFRVKVMRMLGGDNFIGKIDGYDNMIYRLSFDMKF